MKISRSKLNVILSRQGLTLASVAARAGLSRARVYSIMASDVLQPRTVHKIASAVGCDALDILEPEETDSPVKS